MVTQTETRPLHFVSPEMPNVDSAQKMLFAIARLQGQVFNSMMRYQIEALSFLKRRYEQDMKLADELTASDGFKDAFDCDADFLQNAFSEYSIETGKIAAMGSKIATDAARRVRKQAEPASRIWPQGRLPDSSRVGGWSAGSQGQPSLAACEHIHALPRQEHPPAAAALCGPKRSASPRLTEIKAASGRSCHKTSSRRRPSGERTGPTSCSG